MPNIKIKSDTIGVLLLFSFVIVQKNKSVVYYFKIFLILKIFPFATKNAVAGFLQNVR